MDLLALYKNLSPARKIEFANLLYETGMFPGSGGGDDITLPLDLADGAQITNRTTANIAPSTDKNYLTDAQLTALHARQHSITSGSDHAFPGAPTGTYLKDDGTWDTPAGSMPAMAAAFFNDGRLTQQSDTSLTWDGTNIGIFNTSGYELVAPASAPEWTNTMNDLDGNALVPDFNYSLFTEYSSGTVVTPLAKKWTNDTTRAVTPVKWGPAYVYDLTATGKKRRYLGEVRLRNDGGTAKFTDSTTQRFVANLENRKWAYLDISSANAHTYTTAAERPWNNNEAETRLEFLVLGSDLVHIDNNTDMTCNAVNETCMTYPVISYGTRLGAAAGMTVLHASTQATLKGGRHGFLACTGAGYIKVYLAEYGNATSGNYDYGRIMLGLEM